MIRTLIGKVAPLLRFGSSREYWENRYRFGGHSGAGSRGENARYKAAVINDLIHRDGIRSVIEFGCGDGYQLGMFDVANYTGVDVSPTIVRKCREMYAGDPGKRFVLLDEYAGESAEMALSLDVVFHLVEDAVFEQYMERLFRAGQRTVVLYSTDADLTATGTPHVRHRNVTAYVPARFPGFARDMEAESRLPPPVRFDRDLPTRFFIYRRV
jgi:hypothetical protein